MDCFPFQLRYPFQTMPLREVASLEDGRRNPLCALHLGKESLQVSQVKQGNRTFLDIAPCLPLTAS